MSSNALSELKLQQGIEGNWSFLVPHPPASLGHIPQLDSTLQPFSSTPKDNKKFIFASSLCCPLPSSW